MLGIVGLGAIGKEMMKRGKALGMKVIAMDIFLTPEKAKDLEVKFCATAEEVCQQADFITFHVALTPETRGMINKNLLNLMKPDAVFMNIARGEISNEQDIKAHLENNPNCMYVTDVPQGEPSFKKGDFEWPLAKNPQVYATHHIGASTEQSEEDIGREAVRILEEFWK